MSRVPASPSAHQERDVGKVPRSIPRQFAHAPQAGIRVFGLAVAACANVRASSSFPTLPAGDQVGVVRLAARQRAAQKLHGPFWPAMSSQRIESGFLHSVERRCNGVRLRATEVPCERSARSPAGRRPADRATTWCSGPSREQHHAVHRVRQHPEVISDAPGCSTERNATGSYARW